MPAPCIVTFVNAAYVETGRNWLAAIEALRLDAEIRIVALDPAARDAFPSRLTRHIPVGSADLSALWVHRVRVIRALLDEGRDVIHSDADAVWIRDPLPLIAACPADMVFSQGTVWPRDVHGRHGLVVCCGFFRLSPSPAVLAFMRTVEERTATEGDDQVAVNRLLDEGGVAWRIAGPYRIPFGRFSFLASRETIASSGGRSPPVAILPHHVFPRVVDGIEDGAMVVHPPLGKTAAEKEAGLSRLGLWRLPGGGAAQPGA